MMEQGREHRGHRRRRPHQTLQFKGIEPGRRQGFPLPVEQRAVGSLQGQRLQGGRDRLVLDQGAEYRQRPLRYRCLRQGGQSQPDLLPYPRSRLQPGQAHRLGDPFRGPGPLVLPLDPGQGLERDPGARLQRLPSPSGRERRGPRRPALVEEHDPGLGIAEPLQSQKGQQGALARSGRPDNHGVADVAHMEHKPERRRAGRARRRQRRPLQIGVLRRPRPDGGNRQQIGQVQGRDQRPAHIGIGFARQRAQPGLHRIEVLDPGHQPLGVQGRLDRPGLGRGPRLAGVQHGDGQGQVAEGAALGPQGGQGPVAFLGLGRRIRIQERHLLPGDGLAQQDADALALGEPALPQLDDLTLGLGFVQADPACGPAVFERQGPQGVEQPGPGHRRQAPHRDHLEPAVAQPGCHPARQAGVGQPGV